MTARLRSPRNGEAAQSTSARSPKRRRVTVAWNEPGVRCVAWTSNARCVVVRISAHAARPAAPRTPPRRQRSASPFGVSVRAWSSVTGSFPPSLETAADASEVARNAGRLPGGGRAGAAARQVRRPEQLRALLELARRPGEPQPAAVHHVRAGGEAERDSREMLDQEPANAGLRDGADRWHEPLDDDGREAERELIDQEEARLRDERLREHEHLLLAARQRTPGGIEALRSSGNSSSAYSRPARPSSRD